MLALRPNCECCDRDLPPDSASVPAGKPDIRIVQLNGVALHALALGDLSTAEAASPVALSVYLAGPQCRGLWRMRSEQCDRDLSSAAWVTGIVWDETRSFAVGAAGFHGPPDSSGVVEIGYRIDPVHRRRGYARAALEALLARAAREPDVHRVRASRSRRSSRSDWGMAIVKGVMATTLESI